MPNNIWINNHLLFKLAKKYDAQSLYVCSTQYKEELNMEIGDIIYMKDNNKARTYELLGTIKAFNRNKIIVEHHNK